mmetsp:Transcript_50026/g.125481  ORF Transcript_50026/g.125481 Transcript_50026/m.125481 type:complete len:118 (-) Transcript_50026:1149-1502(-)
MHVATHTDTDSDNHIHTQHNSPATHIHPSSQPAIQPRRSFLSLPLTISLLCHWSCCVWRSAPIGTPGRNADLVTSTFGDKRCVPAPSGIGNATHHTHSPDAHKYIMAIENTLIEGGP